jgi:putative sigma-54 modulation protein
MQIHNVNLPITVTGRHVSVTEAMRDYAYKKVENLHLDYPRIIDAKVILDVENKERQKAEIVLHCANHITIEVDTTTGDIYSAIDESVSKLARRMRKYKTRLLKRTTVRGWAPSSTLRKAFSTKPTSTRATTTTSNPSSFTRRTSA